MDNLFKCSNFNGDINNWDTSNVTTMETMFCYTKIFNKDISCWDTSNVTSMSCMFYEAEKFNQDISNWNVTNVTNMNAIFCEAINFAQNIGKWDLSNVKEAIFMLDNAKAFIKKYNNEEKIPSYLNDIKEWLIKNREKMSDIDIKNTHGEEIDNFFNNIYSTNEIGLHNNIHSLNKVELHDKLIS